MFRLNGLNVCLVVAMFVQTKRVSANVREERRLYIRDDGVKCYLFRDLWMFLEETFSFAFRCYGIRF